MKINFENMETQVLPQFKGGEGDFLVKMFTDGAGKIMRGTLPPGACIGYHKHETNCEIIYIISGAGKCKYEDGEETLAAGDCHYCPWGKSHALINNGVENLEFFAVVCQMNGFDFAHIEKTLQFPDTEERPEQEVFNVIFSLGRDAENWDEVKYAYDLLISLTEKKCQDVRVYALASLGVMATLKKKRMLKKIFDKKKVRSLMDRELAICGENEWARGTLECALSDLKRVYHRIKTV